MKHVMTWLEVRREEPSKLRTARCILCDAPLCDVTKTGPWSCLNGICVSALSGDNLASTFDTTVKNVYADA